MREVHDQRAAATGSARSISLPTTFICTPHIWSELIFWLCQFGVDLEASVLRYLKMPVRDGRRLAPAGQRTRVACFDQHSLDGAPECMRSPFSRSHPHFGALGVRAPTVFHDIPVAGFHYRCISPVSVKEHWSGTRARQ